MVLFFQPYSSGGKAIVSNYQQLVDDGQPIVCPQQAANDG